MLRTLTHIAFGVSCAAVLAAPASPAHAQAESPVRVVALTGTPVFGVAPPATYTALNRPVVGGNGRIWFTGQYNSGAFAFIASSDPDIPPTQLFRRSTDPVLELGGAPVIWQGTFDKLAAGNNAVAFAGGYGGGAAGNGLGVWQTASNNLLLTGTTAMGAGAPGTTARFIVFESTALAGGNRLAVRARTDGAAATDTGIWVAFGSAGSALTLFVLEGDLPPDVPADVQYDDLNSALFDPVINPSGTLAFLAPLRGASVSASNNRAVIVGPPGTERVVARTGSQAPGYDAGVVFATLAAPWINEYNDVVFTGRVTGGSPPIGPNNDEALWIVRWPSTTPEGIIFEGDPAPVIGGTILLHERTTGTATFRHTLVTSDGRVGFVSGLLGTGINNDNDSVLYTAKRTPAPGIGWTFTLVAREGQDAPGLTAGADRYGQFDQLWLNGRNDLAFRSNVNNFNSRAALFAGRVGGIRLLAVANGTINIGNAISPDRRTIPAFYNQYAPISSSGGGGRGDGLPTCLSDDGNIVFRVTINGGAAILEHRIHRRGDFNGSGDNSPQDIFDFLEEYFEPDPQADFNNSGDVAVQDIFDFLQSYFNNE